MLLIRRIRTGEGQLFKQMRLAALQESPSAFGSDYQIALSRDGASWSAQADSTAQGPDRSTFLAFTDEMPVGIMALYRCGNEPDVGELLQVWVSPSFRRHGIARALMNAVLRWAKENEFRTVIAKVAGDNRRALDFYRGCGFTSKVDMSVDDTTRTVVLVREFLPAAG